MAKSKFITVDNEKQIKIKRELWEKLETYFNSKNIEKQSIAKTIKEIIKHFTQNENKITKKFKKVLGDQNIEYLINQLIIHIDDIKNKEMAIELKFLLLNYNILILESNNVMDDIFEKLPVLENTDIISKIIYFELKRENYNYSYYSVIVCEEINKLLNRKEFDGIQNFEDLKKYYQSCFQVLTTSYQSLEDDKKHTIDICFGTMYRMMLYFQIPNFNQLLTIDTVEFSQFIDLLFHKLPFLNEHHLRLYNGILSNSSFLNRKNGKQDSRQVLEFLSSISDLEDEKIKIILSFLEHSKNIDSLYCPTYQYFMLYLEIATKSSNEQLKDISNYLLDTTHNEPILLSEIRYLIYDVIQSHFPNIFGLELLFNSSVSIYTQNSGIASISSYDFLKFLDIFASQAKQYCELKDYEIKKLKTLLIQKFKESNQTKYIEFLNRYLEKGKEKSFK